MESMPFIAPTPLCKRLRIQKLQILQPQMENVVLHQKATSGSIPVALELHSFDGNLTMPDDVTYSAMIDAYGRAGNVDMAFSLYDRARTEKWRIDPMTFSTLIKIHGQSGNFDGCLNVYEEMKAIGANIIFVLSTVRKFHVWHVRKTPKNTMIFMCLYCCIILQRSPSFLSYACYIYILKI
nr:pentatricopeptide repeat-containing protein ATP4, chloroplastic-like [Ziziphus jujuba var. spinosa]XP_048327560.1 pentatricopeptide repeat-containing protein ATP4, chloroplastic-like [Ziziphus jujuba var. spinosa]